MPAAERELEEQEASASRELEAMISDAAVGRAKISQLLDDLPAELRPRVVRRLDRTAQRALFEGAEGFAPLRLVDLVPPQAADLAEVRHLGRNTLPAFRIFEKRFCRLAGESPEQPESLAGYNFQAMSRITGPGYFMARNDPDRDEVLVDYRQLPTDRPPHWPEIRSNERGLARFVYGFMLDRLRRVSEHVTVGSAARHGQELGSYFVLSRVD